MAGTSKRTAHQVAESVLAAGGKTHLRALAAKYGHGYVEDWLKLHREETKWAESMLERSDWAGLDTETTHTNDDAELIELGIVRPDGTVWQWLVHPLGDIAPRAIEDHGLTVKDLREAPRLEEIYTQVQEVFDAHELILGYNCEFDKRILQQSTFKSKLKPFKMPPFEDVLLHFSRWAGVWNDKFNDYVWHPLEGGHRAVGDVKRMLSLMRIMARQEAPA